MNDDVLTCPSYTTSCNKTESKYLPEQPKFTYDSEDNYINYSPNIHYYNLAELHQCKIESPIVIVKGQREAIVPNYTNFMKSFNKNSKDVDAHDQDLCASKNYTNFMKSFNKNSKDVDAHTKCVFDKIISVLKFLSIKESLAQYSKLDEMIDINIVLKDGYRLTIGKFMNDESDKEDVDFMVSDGKRVIAAGELTPTQLVRNLYCSIIKGTELVNSK